MLVPIIIFITHYPFRFFELLDIRFYPIFLFSFFDNLIIFLVVGMQTSTATMENRVEIP